MISPCYRLRLPTHCGRLPSSLSFSGLSPLCWYILPQVAGGGFLSGKAKKKNTCQHTNPVSTCGFTVVMPCPTLFNLRGFSSFSALFNLGDPASPLFESEFRSVILFGSNPVASSLSYSDSVRSPILNRARFRTSSASDHLF